MQLSNSNKRLIFCEGIAVLFSIIALLGIVFGMDTKLNTVIGLIGLSFAIIPIVLVGLRRIVLCTSDNFVQPIGSGWEHRCIWLGVDAKKYCDAFNYTVFLCIFSFITSIVQGLRRLPLEESMRVIQVFVILWYVRVIVFFVRSIRKVSWRSYTVTSVVLVGITGTLEPILDWTIGQVRTIQMFIFNSVLLMILFGGCVACVLGYYYRLLGQCVTMSVYLTERPDEVKIIAEDGTVWDRSERLFYPDFSKNGVKITFYNGEPSVFYRYEELQECVVRGNGKSLKFDNEKKDK